jgi:hypothetical protein
MVALFGGDIILHTGTMSQQPKVQDVWGWRGEHELAMTERSGAAPLGAVARVQPYGGANWFFDSVPIVPQGSPPVNRWCFDLVLSRGYMDTEALDNAFTANTAAPQRTSI